MIDALTDAMLGDGVDTMPAVALGVDVEIVTMDAPAITLEFVVGVTYAVGVLAGLLVATIIDVVPAIFDIDMFADESVNGLTAP